MRLQNVFLSKAGNLELGINESGFLQIYFKTSGVEAFAEYGVSGVIPLNQWTYIAVRY
ncbi:hypothetical protein LCGC14_0945060, partial [marine sediment metagenome]